MADTVDITIPPKAEYVGIVRLAAAAVAARQAFSYDEIEDLKIAVSEACNAFIAPRGRTKHPITLRFIPEQNALAVWVEAPGGEIDLKPPTSARRTTPDERALGFFLMECLVDEVRRVERDGSVSLRLLKRRPKESNGGPSSAS